MVECATTLSVKCGDLAGKVLLDKFTARQQCVSCEHGLFKPSVFERLAGKGNCKSWKRTIKCLETGKDLYSLIESGALKLLDEPEGIKKRKSLKTSLEIGGDQVNSENGSSYSTLRRKRGRPRKNCLANGGGLLFEQERENHDSVCSNKEINGDHQSNGSACKPPENTDKLEDETSKDSIRKRKKLEDAKHTPNAVKTNKGIRNGNEGADLNRLSEQLKGVEDSSSSEVSYEIYRTRVPRHGKCKQKRIRCNDFERALNTVVRERKAPTLSLHQKCSICGAQLQDADALKYHDILFHSSVSSRLFVDPVAADETSANNFLNNDEMIKHDDPTGTNLILEDKTRIHHETSVKPCMRSLDMFGDKLTRGTIAKLASIGVQGHVEANVTNLSDTNAVASTSSDTSSVQTSLLASITAQYQEIVGLSKDTLQQTSYLSKHLEELAKSVEEIKTDVRDVSNSLALANMAKSAVRDDITAGDYQTFFKILEKFINSNGHGNVNSSL